MVARLWRSECALGQGGHSCIERSGPGLRQCQRPNTCVAHRLVPISDAAGSEHVVRLALALESQPASDGDAGAAFLRLSLCGASAIGLQDTVLSLLGKLLLTDGLREHAGPNRAQCAVVGSRNFTVAQRAAELARQHRWLLDLLSPWVVQHGPNPLDLVWLLGELWRPQGPVLRRVFKLVASDMAEHVWHSAGQASAHPDARVAGQMALQARDLLATGLPAVRTDVVQLKTHTHSDGDQRFVRQCVTGNLCLDVGTSAAAAEDIATLLAIIEALGVGKEAAKGYGAVRITGIL